MAKDELGVDFDKIDELVKADNAAKEREPKIEIIKEKSEPNDDIEIQTEEDVQSGIDSLKAQLTQSEKLRKEAERRAFDAANTANRAVTEAEDTNLRLVVNAIETVKAEQNRLKVEYSSALAVGDYDKVAEINAAMISNDGNLKQLENGKLVYENRPKDRPKPVMNDPVERFAANLSEKSADWVRAHPQYVLDAALQKDMFAADRAAGINGIIPDSPAYFNFVERWLEIDEKSQQKRDEKYETTAFSEAASMPRRAVAPAAAPTSRQNAAGVTNPNHVRLTRDEVDAAEASGLTPEEYLKNKIRLQKDGRLGTRNYN